MTQTFQALVRSRMFQMQWLLRRQPMRGGRAWQCQLLLLEWQWGWPHRSQEQIWWRSAIWLQACGQLSFGLR